MKQHIKGAFDPNLLMGGEDTPSNDTGTPVSSGPTSAANDRNGSKPKRPTSRQRTRPDKSTPPHLPAGPAAFIERELRLPPDAATVLKDSKLATAESWFDYLRAILITNRERVEAALAANAAQDNPSPAPWAFPKRPTNTASNQSNRTRLRVKIRPAQDDALQSLAPTPCWQHSINLILMDADSDLRGSPSS